MKSIYYAIIGISLALVGCFLNPMYWISNFKGTVNIWIYIYSAMFQIGLIMFGIAIGKPIEDD